jgi:hypothetical protein
MVRVPEDWAAAVGLSLGDTIYALGKLDGTVELTAYEREFAKAVRFRMRDRGYPVVTIPASIARTRGMERGTVVEFDADEASGVLTLRKLGGEQ